MDRIQIYFDEDAMDSDLVLALRSRGVKVLTVLDTGSSGESDAEQLALATRQNCVLYSFNVGDFFRLHSDWLRKGQVHAGMILAAQQRFSTGEQLRRILRLRAAVSAGQMRGRVEFLKHWG